MLLKSAALLAIAPLADVSSELPPGFDGWLRNLLYLAGLAFFVLQIWGQFRRKPGIDVEITNLATKDSVTKLELRIPEFATRAEVQEIADDLSTQLTGMEKHLDHRRSVSIGTLHSALTATKEQVAALTAEAGVRTQQLGRIETQIGHILERLPRHRS